MKAPVDHSLAIRANMSGLSATMHMSSFLALTQKATTPFLGEASKKVKTFSNAASKHLWTRQYHTHIATRDRTCATSIVPREQASIVASTSRSIFTGLGSTMGSVGSPPICQPRLLISSPSSSLWTPSPWPSKVRRTCPRISSPVSCTFSGFECSNVSPPKSSKFTSQPFALISAATSAGVTSGRQKWEATHKGTSSLQ